jgi:hypothetical protein
VEKCTTEKELMRRRYALGRKECQEKVTHEVTKEKIELVDSYGHIPN